MRKQYKSFVVPAKTVEEWFERLCSQKEKIFRVFQQSNEAIVEVQEPENEERWTRIDHAECGPYLSKVRFYGQGELRITIRMSHVYWSPDNFDNGLVAVAVEGLGNSFHIAYQCRKKDKRINRFRWFDVVKNPETWGKLIPVIQQIGQDEPSL